MAQAKVGHLDDIEGAYGGIFKPVARHLGVTAFGVNVEEFPQNHEDYPEHDHGSDGQEEVYIVISGQATLTIDAYVYGTAAPATSPPAAPPGATPTDSTSTSTDSTSTATTTDPSTNVPAAPSGATAAGANP